MALHIGGPSKVFYMHGGRQVIGNGYSQVSTNLITTGSYYIYYSYILHILLQLYIPYYIDNNVLPVVHCYRYDTGYLQWCFRCTRHYTC